MSCSSRPSCAGRELNMRLGTSPAKEAREGAAAAAAGSSRSPAVKSFSCTSDFGWGFPELQEGPVVVDNSWMTQYNQEIEQVQAKIRVEESVCEYEPVLPVPHRRCWPHLQAAPHVCPPRHPHNAPLIPTSCHAVQTFGVQNVSRNVDDALHLSSNDSGYGDSLEPVGTCSVCFESDKTNEAKCGQFDEQSEAKCEPDNARRVTGGNECGVQGVDRCVPEEATSEPGDDRCLSGGLCKCSVSPERRPCRPSLVSLDSGVFTDTADSPLIEEWADQSILSELEEVLGARPVTLSSYIKQVSLSTPAVDEETGDKCPVWFSRFLSDTEPHCDWRSLTWDRGDCTYDSSGHSRTSHPTCACTPASADTQDLEDYGAEDLVKEARRAKRLQQLRLSCQQLRRQVSCGQSNGLQYGFMLQLSQDFSHLNQRLQQLQHTYKTLQCEVNESKQDFMDLESRSVQLVARTVRARVQLCRVRALQQLERRLREEWWAARYPDAFTLSQNYIV